MREIAALAALAQKDMGLLMSLRAKRHSPVLAGVSLFTTDREIAALAALAQKDMQRLMSLGAKRHAPVLTGVTPTFLPQNRQRFWGRPGGGPVRVCRARSKG